MQKLFLCFIFFINIAVAQANMQLTKVATVSISHEYFGDEPIPFVLKPLEPMDSFYLRQSHGKAEFYLKEGEALPESIVLSLHSNAHAAVPFTLFTQQLFHNTPFMGTREPFSDEITFYEYEESNVEFLEFNTIIDRHGQKVSDLNGLAIIRLSLLPNNAEEIFVKLETLPVRLTYCIFKPQEWPGGVRSLQFVDAQQEITFALTSQDENSVCYSSNELIKLFKRDNGRFNLVSSNSEQTLILPSGSYSNLNLNEGVYEVTAYVYL